MNTFKRVSRNTTHVLAVAAAVLLAAGSCTLAAESAAIQPFNGRDLTGWKPKKEGDTKSQWKVGKAEVDPADPKKLVVKPGGSDLVNVTEAHGNSLDLYSTVVSGDSIITLEVMVPKASNSGIYVMGEYEVQVLDSFGKDQNPGNGDMGAVYGAQPPKNPKYKAPGEWNTYEIHWQAPRFDASGKKVGNAKFRKVVLNGNVIHENLEMPGPTPGGVDGKEKPEGPIMFQGNHGAVAYRNIKIVPAKF